LSSRSSRPRTTKGVTAFVVTDEQHYVTYDKDPKFVFLETVNEEGLTVVGQFEFSLI
jgi:hypothetical protein